MEAAMLKQCLLCCWLLLFQLPSAFAQYQMTVRSSGASSFFDLPMGSDAGTLEGSGPYVLDVHSTFYGHSFIQQATSVTLWGQAQLDMNITLNGFLHELSMDAYVTATIRTVPDDPAKRLLNVSYSFDGMGAREHVYFTQDALFAANELPLDAFMLPDQGSRSGSTSVGWFDAGYYYQNEIVTVELGQAYGSADAVAYAVSVPEPATYALLCAGLLLIALRRRPWQVRP
jgi:hypothetical protein